MKINAAWLLIPFFILFGLGFIAGVKWDNRYWEREGTEKWFTLGAKHMRGYLWQFDECRPYLPEIKKIDLDAGEPPPEDVFYGGDDHAI